MIKAYRAQTKVRQNAEMEKKRTFQHRKISKQLTRISVAWFDNVYIIELLLCLKIKS